jgi:hypothetical protein
VRTKPTKNTSGCGPILVPEEISMGGNTMEHSVNPVWKWIRTVLKQWKFLVSGWSASLGGWLWTQFGSGGALPAHLFYGASAVLILVAFYLSWRDEEQKAFKLAQQLAEIHESRPRLRPKYPNPVSVADIALFQGTSSAFVRPFVRIRLINEPQNPYPNTVAPAITARVAFKDERGDLLLEIDGRWADSDQPSTRDWRLSRNDLLQMSFGIHAEHSLDIAFHDKDDRWFAWNNDSYNSPYGRNSDHQLIGNRIQITVRLFGVYVAESFVFEMWTNADGKIEVSQPPQAW